MGQMEEMEPLRAAMAVAVADGELRRSLRINGEAFTAMYESGIRKADQLRRRRVPDPMLKPGGGMSARNRRLSGDCDSR